MVTHTLLLPYPSSFKLIHCHLYVFFLRLPETTLKEFTGLIPTSIMRFSCAILALLVLISFGSTPAAAQTFRAPTPDPTTLTGFGRAVAVSNNAVFIGEPQTARFPGEPHNAPGTVFVYTAGADGTWTESTRLTASDTQLDDQFGETLATDGTTLVVGATQKNDGKGAAYVFVRDKFSGMWQQTARLVADDGTEGDQFGTSVSVNGDAILVGASHQAEETGASYVFQRGADGAWMQTAKLLSNDAETGDRFGSSVAIEGNHALIGANRHNQRAGAVYAFRLEKDTWKQAQKMEADSTSPGSFGTRLRIQGNEALVTALSQQFNGAVYVYREEGGTWTSAGTLNRAEAVGHSGFGLGLAFNGDEIWVGAAGLNGQSGMVYLFQRAEDNTWAESAQLSPPDGRTGGLFGAAVDARGDVGAVGAFAADYQAGIAAIYNRTADGWTTSGAQASEVRAFEAMTGDLVPCEEGKAGAFECDGIDVVSYIPIEMMGGKRGVQVNDVWGWTDPETGAEYALVGRMDGSSFINITDPYQPVYIGDLPKTEGSPGAIWRDIKVYNDHAFIVADGSQAHGMQVFDLRQLRNVKPEDMPATFEVTAHYDKIHSAHNIVINEDTGFAYTVGNSSGGETCGGAFHMINIQDPNNPTFAGCYADPGTGFSQTGYTHDAQCVTYNGPDADYQGKEICFGASETAIGISDVTDKENPVSISTGAHPNVGYTHQGWLTEDQRFFYVNDELDELGGNVTNTRTLIWDVEDLDDPQLASEFLLETESSDHNLYVKGRYMYQANYLSGLRIFDIANEVEPVEVAYFDTVPYGHNGAGFAGAFSVYPYFKSGVLVVTSMSEGMFILKQKEVGL